jgi:hypothetical protein
MKEMRRALLRAVGERIDDYGFESRPIGQSFLRRFPKGRASLHLAFVEHRVDYDVVADVAVRFDELEELVNAISFLSKKEKEQTYSLGAELGNIAGEVQLRWKVACEDIGQVADRVITSFRAIGLPYLAQASTMEGAYKMLTTPGKGAWLHSPIHTARAKRVVGLAKILEKPDDMAARSVENLRLLENIIDIGLRDFRQFVSALGVKT